MEDKVHSVGTSGGGDANALKCATQDVSLTVSYMAFVLTTVVVDEEPPAAGVVRVEAVVIVGAEASVGVVAKVEQFSALSCRYCRTLAVFNSCTRVPWERRRVAKVVVENNHFYRQSSILHCPCV